MKTSYIRSARVLCFASALLLCRHSETQAQETHQHGTHQHAATEHAHSEVAQTPDQIRAAIQGICPVSGLKLGEHGAPVKAKIGGEIVFLCCDGCIKGQVKKEHWAKIHQNLFKAQAKCVVMDNPLPKKPKWVIVKGQLIYVCCPPCIEKINQSPDEYLAKVNNTYSQFLNKQNGARKPASEPTKR